MLTNFQKMFEREFWDLSQLKLEEEWLMNCMKIEQQLCKNSNGNLTLVTRPGTGY